MDNVYDKIRSAAMEAVSDDDAAVAFAREMVRGSKVPTPEQVRDAIDIMVAKKITNLGYAREILRNRGQWQPPISMSRGVHELDDPFA